MKHDATLDNLLSDKNFLFDSLIGLINEESKRIIAQNLANKKELDSLVIPVLKNSAVNQNHQQALRDLSELHHKLSSVKLPTDFQKTAGFLEIEVVPTNNDMYSLKGLDKQNHDVCCSGCESDGPCCDIEEVEDKEEENEDDAKDMELKSFLSKELEKIAHAAGKEGNHEAAYIIESFIKNIK